MHTTSSSQPIATSASAPAPTAAPGQDSGAQDTGTRDTGRQDTGTQDAGTKDAGAREAGARETGAPDAGRFVERRRANRGASQGKERRQFGSSYHDLSADARELAMAIDGYKVKHRRRYVTFEEMLKVIHDLGYERPQAG